MAARTYRLRIAREGREFEAEGDKNFIFEMLKKYGPEAPVSTVDTAKSSQRTPPKPAASKPPIPDKSLSIREFVQQLNLKKHTDITLAFGYFLEKYQGVSEFTPADINNCYYEAKLESSNTSQMVIQNIKRGYLMPSKGARKKGRKLYTLTRSGEQFIQSKLQSNP